MRWPCLVAVLLGLSLQPARSQGSGILVELILEETIFLPGEEIPVGVRVSNLAGRPVTFADHPRWLTFYVESKNGDIPDRLRELPLRPAFTLEPAKAGTTWWDIGQCFDLLRGGQYNVRAEVLVTDWDQSLLSAPAQITIQPARKFWETAFGVPPDPDRPEATPEIRRFALQTAVRERERRLYARVTSEDEGHIFRVVLLDRMLSFSNPEQQLDGSSQLHVLFQTGGSSYTYTVIDPNGEMVVRQRHDIASGIRPRLVKANNGQIAVTGGVRFPTPMDIPPYTPPPPSAAPITVAPAVTNAPAELSRREKRAAEREQRRLEREKARDQNRD